MSNREKLRQANFVNLNDQVDSDNLVKMTMREYNKQEDKNAGKTKDVKKKENAPMPEPTVPEKPVADPKPLSNEIVETPRQNVGGRPKKYHGELKQLKLIIPEDKYMFIKKNGWKYDGMCGYINHLIEEEMKRQK